MRRGKVRYLGWVLIAAVFAYVAFGAYRTYRRYKRDHAPKVESHGDLVLVTGYCNCGKCCGWKRNWFGFGVPVYDYGPMKGKPKRVGITATGTTAKHGTIAADPKIFKFGTKLYIPGYGAGVVEDIGGAIKGKHIDIWFSSHEEAIRWGRKNLNVRVIER